MPWLYLNKKRGQRTWGSGDLLVCRVPDDRDKGLLVERLCVCVSSPFGLCTQWDKALMRYYNARRGRHDADAHIGSLFSEVLALWNESRKGTFDPSGRSARKTRCMYVYAYAISVITHSLQRGVYPP